MSELYSPGPWDQSNGKIFGSTATAIATVHKHQSPTVTLSNARLITAAPELLEALKNLLTYPLGTFQVEAAKAAIAKATGQ